MAKHTHNIPAVLEPEGDLCVPLFIPAHEDYVSLVVRQLRLLTLDRHYDRDENHSALVVREQFDTRMYQPFIDALYDGTGCPEDSGSDIATCFRVNAASEGITYYPNDPFTGSLPDDPVLFGMVWRRWGDAPLDSSPVFQYIEDLLSNFLGYYPNDVIVFPDQLLDFAFGGLGDLLNYVTLETFPFPFLRWDFEGSGEVDIELINFPFGGSCFLIPDMELTYQELLAAIIEIIDLDGDIPAGWVIAELDRDILAFPPETPASVGFEMQFAEDGQHSLNAVFVPRLNDTLPFFFPFGGFREIEVCDGLKVVGSQTGTLIDKDNAGASETIRGGAIGMGTVDEICEGVKCAIVDIMQSAAAAVNSGVSISVDGDGNAVIDADTKSNLTPELLFGEMLAIAEGVKEYFDWWNDNYSGHTQAYYNDRLPRVYEIETPDTVVADYFNWRDPPNNNPEIPFVALASPLARYFFCNGASRQVLAEFIIEQITYSSEEEETIALDIVSLIKDEQFESWRKEGVGEPRDGYQSADCYTLADQFIDYDADNVIADEWNEPFYITQLQGNRLRRLEVTGRIVDDEGRVYDGMFYKDENGDITYSPTQLQHQTLFSFSPDAQPPYNPAGGYGANYTDANSNRYVLRINLENTADQYLDLFVNPVGKIEYVLKDLGSL